MQFTAILDTSIFRPLGDKITVAPTLAPFRRALPFLSDQTILDYALQQLQV